MLRTPSQRWARRGGHPIQTRMAKMADGSPAGVSGLGGDEQGWVMVNWVENPTRRLLAGPVSSGASSDVSSLTHAMPSSISSTGQAPAEARRRPRMPTHIGHARLAS